MIAAVLGLFSFPSRISTSYNENVFIYAYAYLLFPVYGILYTLFLYTVLVMGFDRIATGSKINVAKVHLILIAVLILANLSKFFSYRPYCYAYNLDYDYYNYDQPLNGTAIGTGDYQEETRCSLRPALSFSVLNIINLAYTVVMHVIPIIILIVVLIKGCARRARKVKNTL